MSSGCWASCLHRELSRAEGINVETDIPTCKSALLLKDPPQALLDCHVASEESNGVLSFPDQQADCRTTRHRQSQALAQASAKERYRPCMHQNGKPEIGSCRI
jgi:hypothetical protein